MSPSWTVANCWVTRLNLWASTYPGSTWRKYEYQTKSSSRKNKLTVSNPEKRVLVDRNSNDGHPRRPMWRRKCGCFATNIMRRMRGRIRNNSESNY
jgi:hypothetical protein